MLDGHAFHGAGSRADKSSDRPDSRTHTVALIGRRLPHSRRVVVDLETADLQRPDNPRFLDPLFSCLLPIESLRNVPGTVFGLSTTQFAFAIAFPVAVVLHIRLRRAKANIEAGYARADTGTKSGAAPG